jgi:hypothetical protein
MTLLERSDMPREMLQHIAQSGQKTCCFANPVGVAEKLISGSVG